MKKKDSFIKSSNFAWLIFVIFHRGPMKLPSAIFSVINCAGKKEILYLLLYSVMSVMVVFSVVLFFVRRKREQNAKSNTDE